MVRHEAAEALGSIATEECLPVLKEFAEDDSVPRVVKESCEVALDMVESSSPSPLILRWAADLLSVCSMNMRDLKSFRLLHQLF